MILFSDAIPAALLAYMLAEQLSGCGIEDANEKFIPLHVHRTSDPARRRL
jgi:hypothetical protein